MNIGDKLENFTLPVTGDDGEFTLSDAAGKLVVLYFYPKDDTPGCTLEGKEFSALLPSFEKAGCLVFGVSRDNVRSHERFRQKYNYDHHLLADTEAALCHRFGVLRAKKMFGKPVTGVSRSTFLIDGDGILAAQWRAIKDAAGHAQTVLDEALKLRATVNK